MSIKGLVLAGGKSRRLGRDKVLETVSGVSLLERSLGLMRQVADEVWVSGRDPQAMGLDAPWLPDDVTGCGPMGGILTGLKHLGAPLVVMACDLPFMNLATLQRLVAAREERRDDAVMTTFLQVETGFIESLVAVYEAGAEELLLRSLARDRYKISAAMPKELRHHIPYTQEQADVFFNINYPADLAVLKRVITGQGAVET